MHIEKVILKDVTSDYLIPDNIRFNDLTECNLQLELSFAKELRLGDTIWMNDEDLSIEDYPYIINLTPELLKKWSDGWYQIIRKNYIGKLIEFDVIEMHCEETKKLLITTA
ncbi:hypothetical protein [Aquimarina sp. 2201CG14-23]|uniref:hypothetical protein n=1 Tax=Aquimarina mycalae TaxID=3040073 RepID=UPI002477EE54|nr:hypothetical protein [Aquimarina sp. 2201CG14-23]MDH7447238.1 hypothetical protein [Aquimarina sp. 2201CG14-23]